MSEDIKIPNATLYVLVLAAEEVMGKNGLASVFNQGGLPFLVNKRPPNNMEKQVPYSLYGKVQQSIEDFYGPRGSRAILTRVGRANFRYTLNEQPTLVGLGSVVLKVLPQGARMKIILEGANKAANEEFSMDSELSDEGDTYAMRRKYCPCSFRERDPGHGPCDYVTIGSLQEGLKWATGKNFKVKQTKCINIGDDIDEFVIDKQPMDD